MRVLLLLLALGLGLVTAQDVEMPTASSRPEPGLFPVGAILEAQEQVVIREDRQPALVVNGVTRYTRSFKPIQPRSGR